MNGEINIFWPNLIGIFATAYGVSTLASIAGIGGGGMLIPLYAIVGNLELKEAIILSIITIAGNSLVRACYYSFRKHKNAKNRFLPNYDIARVVVPFDANVAYLGFVLNEALPTIAIFIILVFLLLALIYKTVKKTIAFIRKRNVKDSVFIVYDNIDIELPEITSDVILDRKGDVVEGEDGTKKNFFIRNSYVIKNYLYLLSSFVTVAIFSFIRKQSDNQNGSPWIIYGAQFIVILLLGYVNIMHVLDIYKLKKKSQYNWVQGDIPWDKAMSFIKYTLAASFTGFISTMVGIGGSMIMNPIMINFKVLPDVVVATSSITSFFSSVVSALQFIINDGVFEWYFPVLFILGGLAAFTSIIIIRFLKKNIRMWITVILSICLIASFILLVVFNVVKFMTDGIE